MINDDNTLPPVTGSDRQRRLQDLVQRLIELEAEIEQLSEGQIDAIVSPSVGPILLRQARESSRISEQHFRAVFDNALDAMLVTDDNGRYIDANAAACVLFGLLRGELLGKQAADFAVPVADGQANQGAFPAAGTMRGEFVLVRLDGSVRVTEFSASTSIMPGRHLSILRDVTARKDAEEQLGRLTEKVHAQAQQLQQVMDMAPMGLFLLDSESRIVLANPRAEAELRLLADVKIGEPIQQLAGQPLPEVLKPAQEGTQPTELVIHHPQRRVFTVLANPVTLRGEESGWVVLLQDVTVEQERQERVHQQDRLAAVGQLAAGIAHDFNNLLAVIMLYTQLLQRSTNLSPGEQKRLTVILEQGILASHLVQQILDFSRKSVIERNPMDLLRSIDEMVVLWKHTLPENIHIVWQHQAPSDYVVNADPTRLQQVLMNLVINARDAMPHGGELRIALHHVQLEAGDLAPLPEMEPGTWIAIAVHDTGSGIVAEHLPHMFEPFFTTKGASKGTGLGLAQVYGIVRQHDGVIGVQSREGQGTIFTVYLPAASLPALHFEQKELLPMETPATSHQTILLVEDNAAVREATRGILETQGYHVLEAENGRQAIELFQRHVGEIALVLSDLVMPEMGGVELYRLLHNANADIKMIIMTGYPLEDGGRQLLEEGIVAWLHKPFTVQELARKIHQTLHP